LTSDTLTGSTGSCAGSAQSRNAGKLQYHFPPSFHLGGAMSLHLTGAAAVFMTRLMGSTKTSVSLNVTGISLCQGQALARDECVHRSSLQEERVSPKEKKILFYLYVYIYLSMLVSMYPPPSPSQIILFFGAQNRKQFDFFLAQGHTNH